VLLAADTRFRVMVAVLMRCSLSSRAVLITYARQARRLCDRRRSSRVSAL
jgi:hypothetical protein